MQPVFGQLRQWRVLYTLTGGMFPSIDFIDGHAVPRVLRKTILAETPSEAEQIAKINCRIVATGPYHRPEVSIPTILAVKPWVKL